LLRDGKYALQTFPQPKPGSDEFYIAGKAVLVDDPAACSNILRDAKHMADASETAFELWIDRVMHTTWEHVLTPQMRSKHRKVARADRSGYAELAFLRGRKTDPWLLAGGRRRSRRQGTDELGPARPSAAGHRHEATRPVS